MRNVQPFCQEHAIGVMAYAPLSKGLLTGKFDADTRCPENDLRSRMGEFQGEAFQKRLNAAEQMNPIAEKHGKTLAQLTINWNLFQPGVTTALTGAKTPTQVRENAGGASWKLTQTDLDEIEKIVSGLTDVS